MTHSLTYLSCDRPPVEETGHIPRSFGVDNAEKRQILLSKP